jgi:predicted small lipoprotein YifL
MKIKTILPLLAISALTACGGGGGGGVPPPEDNRSPEYLAKASNLEALAAGMRNGNASGLYADALDKFYTMEKAKEGQTFHGTFSSAAGDFAELVNKPSDEMTDADELADLEIIRQAYVTDRNSNAFVMSNNQNLDWNGTYNGDVVVEDKTVVGGSPMGVTYNWVDKGTIALTVNQSGHTLTASFTGELDDHGPLSGTLNNGNGMFYTKKNGNEVTGIAGSASTSVVDSNWKSLYFNVEK